jgi:hypothetical protein
MLKSIKNKKDNSMTNFEIFKKGAKILNIDLERYFSEDDSRWDGTTFPTHKVVIDEYNQHLNTLDENEKEIASRYVDMHYEIKEITQVGGEGEGSDYYYVYHFPTVDMYVRFQGSYQSYHGADYSHCFEIRPQQKTITVYEAE